MKQLVFLWGLILFLLSSCSRNEPSGEAVIRTVTTVSQKREYQYFVVDRDVRLGNYFQFLDRIVARYDSLLRYPFSEHFLVRANPWLIDTLAATDYYRLMSMGKFIYDPKSIIILHKGDSLLIPDSLMVDSLRFRMATAVIDINIPEFRLRIRELDSIMFEFPVRVGRNERKFLAMAGHRVDLRTRLGTGTIVRVNRAPLFINPADNHPYQETRRDDGKVTKLPNIPWLEPELDGQRYGQLIHPTTNPQTLGRAYSNGCIGTGEAAAWYIYYHAPAGTKVIIRYKLHVPDAHGDSLRLKDIYPGFEKVSPSLAPPVTAYLFPPHRMLSGCSETCLSVWGEELKEFLN